MIEENPNEEQSRGLILWEKAKQKIRAVQSFLRLNNDKNSSSDKLLSKRQNPYQEENNNENVILDEAVCKKLKDNNGDPKPQVIEDDGLNLKRNYVDDKMEVLEEGISLGQNEKDAENKDSQLEKSTSKSQENNEIRNNEEISQANEGNIEKTSSQRYNDESCDEDKDENKNEDNSDNNQNKSEEAEEEDSDNEDNNDNEGDCIDIGIKDDNNDEDLSEQDKDDEKEEEQNDDGDDDEEEENEDDEEEEEENEDDDDDEEEVVDEKRNEEDKLVKNENIYVTEAILDEESEFKQTGIEKNEKEYTHSNISFDINEEDNVITVKICNREYKIDLKKEYVKKNEKLIKIVNDMADLIEQLKIKQNEKIEELKKIADHNQFTALEYYLMKTIDDIFKEERGIQNQQWQEEICCICQCDLFDNINNYTQDDFLQQLKNSSDDDPINLAHCEAHFFHKGCLKMMIQSTHIKCPVCSKIYGVMIGDQPPGSMNIYLDKYSSCDGYPNNSTIVIEMRMNSTMKNGAHVPSTSRTGYLPNTEEARKVLEMFKRAFKRRLLYTIGKSVTTGKDNRIIWNGVHFKTNTYGGSPNFGFPDPTYLQRVTQELSLKGIYPLD